jgi:hypothetical protein
VQLATDRTDLFNQACFDIHVNIFAGDREDEAPCFDLKQDVVKTRNDRFGLAIANER